MEQQAWGEQVERSGSWRNVRPLSHRLCHINYVSIWRGDNLFVGVWGLHKLHFPINKKESKRKETAQSLEDPAGRGIKWQKRGKMSWSPPIRLGYKLSNYPYFCSRTLSNDLAVVVGNLVKAESIPVFYKHRMWSRECYQHVHCAVSHYTERGQTVLLNVPLSTVLLWHPSVFQLHTETTLAFSKKREKGPVYFLCTSTMIKIQKVHLYYGINFYIHE